MWRNFNSFDVIGCTCLDNSWGVRENTIIVIKLFLCCGSQKNGITALWNYAIDMSLERSSEKNSQRPEFWVSIFGFTCVVESSGLDFEVWMPLFGFPWIAIRKHLFKFNINWAFCLGMSYQKDYKTAWMNLCRVFINSEFSTIISSTSKMIGVLREFFFF